MVSITLSIPDETRELMKRFPEINWSQIVRKAITEKAKNLALKEEMLKELGKDKQFNEWAVRIVREGRKK